MRRLGLALAFIFLLFIFSSVHADQPQQQTTPVQQQSNPLGDFITSSTSDVQSQGQAFWQEGVALKNIGTGTFVSVYQAFTPTSCRQVSFGLTNNAFANIILVWLEPTILMALIICLGIASIYMIGQLLSSAQLIQMAKDEGFQTMLTMVRVVFLGISLMAGATFYSLSAGAATNDPIYSRYGQSFMIEGAMAFARMMLSDMSTHYSMLILYNMVLHTIYSSTMWFGVTWRAMYSFNLGPVLRPLIDVIGTSLQFLSLGMSEWMLHIITLCLIEKWAFVLFMPLSMLLRAFPFTRTAGEAIFALTFALTVLYPLMFLVDYEVHKIMSYNLTDASSAMGSFINKSGILNVFGAVLIVMFLMAGVFMPFFLGGALTLAFELIKGAVYYVVIISILLPVINIFVTLTAARETAKFFNVDVNFMAFLKVI